MSKNFSKEINPALAFISRVESKTEHKTLPNEEATEQKNNNYKKNPIYVETKSKRVQLLIKPSVYNKLKTFAMEQDISVNEIINRVLEDFVSKERCV